MDEVVKLHFTPTTLLSACQGLCACVRSLLGPLHGLKILIGSLRSG